MLELTGKVAVVTGANAGIGAETARLLCRQGAALVLVARRVEPLEQGSIVNVSSVAGSVGFLEPEYQAKAILFFASDDAQAITGQWLQVDRGFY